MRKDDVWQFAATWMALEGINLNKNYSERAAQIPYDLFICCLQKNKQRDWTVLNDDKHLLFVYGTKMTKQCGGGIEVKEETEQK